jgi:hypothetical protein
MFIKHYEASREIKVVRGYYPFHSAMDVAKELGKARVVETD